MKLFTNQSELIDLPTGCICLVILQFLFSFLLARSDGSIYSTDTQCNFPLAPPPQKNVINTEKNTKHFSFNQL